MANTNDKNEDKDFPGYPHYPAKEDIMNQKDVEKVEVDVENLSRANNITSSELPDRSIKKEIPESKKEALTDVDADEIVPGDNDADLTPEDLVMLGEEDTDFGNREELTGDDLDVPGSEEDDADEEIGEEDEENNYYSLGGDDHENLEEDKG